MKSIVTGGAGFIGSHLVDSLLNENFEVTVIDNFSTGHPENLAHVREKIKLVEGDLAVQGAWKKEFSNIDWVLHLAALADIVPSIQQPEAYFRANVDGTFNAEQRNERLNWLKHDPDDNICRVLTNVRCLAEGVDVPSLDAIMFLHPRKSQIDVVQGVGRVMRKAVGKDLGYVILPITVAPGVTPEKHLEIVKSIKWFGKY